MLSRHTLFHNIAAEEPRAITSAVDTGFQSVFDPELYKTAIESGTYTAGGNLFWVDALWSPTPGVPLRLQAVLTVAETVFQRPTAYPGALHVAVAQGDDPLRHRGAWQAMSPEEIRHAMIFAVASAVCNEPDNLNLLNDWKRCVLSTTFTFKVLETTEQRLWYALQERENLYALHLAVRRRRSDVRRCHEVDQVRRTLSESETMPVTPQMIFDDSRNLVMVDGAPGTVTRIEQPQISEIVSNPVLNGAMLLIEAVDEAAAAEAEADD